MSIVEGFQKNCYAIRQDGTPMPAMYVGKNEDGRVDVKAPNGRTYTFNPDAICTVQEVEDLLRSNKAATVANSYTFEDVPGMPVRTVKVSHPSSRSRSYVILETAAGYVCSCPSCAKNLFDGCKHIDGLIARETSPEQRRMTAECRAAVNTYESVTRAAEKAARPAPKEYQSGEW